MSKHEETYDDDKSYGTTFRECDHVDCHEEGEFRAPKSRMLDRRKADAYQWFCMAHVREFNKAWNFFDGMSEDEVLRYKDEDVTGHRPTWKMGSRTAKARHEFNYDDPFDFREEMWIDSSTQNNGQTAQPKIDKEERDALAVLNLKPGSSLKDIKCRHKELAKKYHPDIRGGDKKAEEILKNINQAYTHLRSCANS